MSKTTTRVEIKAPIKKVFEVLSDFESYPEFLSGSKKVNILKKSAKKMQVEFQMDVIKTISYTLDVELKSPTEITWTLVKGDFMKSNTGAWKLTEKKKGVTEAVYEIEIGFGMLVPKSVASMLVEKNLPGMMKEFKERVEND